MAAIYLGGQEQKCFSLLGSKLCFHSNSKKKKLFCNATDIATLSCVWKQEFYRNLLYFFLCFRFTGHFIGLSSMGKYMAFHRLQRAFENVFMQNNLTGSNLCSSCELMVHPGYKSIIGCGGCGEGPDLFACSEEREHELTTLTSTQLKEYLRSSNIRLCSFKDLW